MGTVKPAPGESGRGSVSLGDFADALSTAYTTKARISDQQGQIRPLAANPLDRDGRIEAPAPHVGSR
jgi:hypothetical protein